MSILLKFSVIDYFFIFSLNFWLANLRFLFLPHLSGSTEVRTTERFLVCFFLSEIICSERYCCPFLIGGGKCCIMMIYPTAGEGAKLY